MSVPTMFPIVNYYLSPRWVTTPGAEDGGWGYYAALEVESHQWLAEGESREQAAARAEARYPGAIRMSNTERGWMACDQAVRG